MNQIFVLMVLICIRVLLVNIIFVSAINITNKHNTGLNNESFVSDLRLLFNETSFICINSESEKIVKGLLKVFNDDYKLILINYLSKLFPKCTRVFIFETNNYTTLECEGIIDSSQTTVFYVINDSITDALRHGLEACLSVAQSPEVLAVSLSDSSLLQLSPVFPQPRHFVRTSFTQVLQRRVDKSKKLDLQGSAVTIGILYSIPFFFYINENDCDGSYIPLVQEMARQFNFSYTYLKHRYFGQVLSNGTWAEGRDGGNLGHDIQEGRVDIIATEVWQSLGFYELMDFGPSLTKASLAFLVMRPEKIDFQWQDILRIFDPKVWYAIFGSFVMTVMVYWAGVNWDPRSYTESWSSCILTLFGFFTATTSHRRVDDGNTRFTLTGWSFLSLLITTTLASGIVTRLTIPLYSPRINTVEQLVQGDYFWTVQFYSDYINTTLLRESTFDLKNHWIQQFEQRYVFMDGDTVNATAGTNRKLAFVAQIYGTDYVILDTDGLDGHKTLSNYRMSKEAFSEAHVSFGVKKQSFLYEPVTKLSLIALQVGLMTRWHDEMIRRWPEFDTKHLLIEQDIPTFTEPQGLPFSKVQPVFLLLLFGLGLASIVFLIEIIIGLNLIII